LEAGETAVVEPREAEDVRRDRALRIDAPLLGIEIHAREMQLLEARRLRRIGLPRDVDEARLPVRELIVQRVRVDAQRSPGRRPAGAPACAWSTGGGWA